MPEMNYDEMAALRSLIHEEMSEVNTAIPAVILSYADGLATVRPVGTRKLDVGGTLDYPVIANVPVSWPRFAGDNAGVKGPISPGDKCMLVFAQRALDEFMGGGDDTRMYDLTDAVAIMGVYPRTIGQHAANNTDMVMYFGAAYIKLTPGGRLEIYAPGGTRIDTPEAENTGKLINRKEITGQKGLNITGIHGDTGIGSRVTGDFHVVSGDVKADSISLKNHVHGGVQTGSGNTGVPQ